MDKVIFLCIFFAQTSTCFALPTDKEKEIFFRAESVDMNQQSRHGLYVGEVEIDQGSTHIRAHMVETQGDKIHQITMATLKGDQKNQAHYWTLSDENKPPLHAYADLIYYYPVRHFVELIGHARVEQGENVINAHRITYNTETQHVLSTSDGKSLTTIIIHPEKKT